jgi:hypothetical protein
LLSLALFLAFSLFFVMEVGKEGEREGGIEAERERETREKTELAAKYGAV